MTYEDKRRQGQPFKPIQEHFRSLPEGVYPQIFFGGVIKKVEFNNHRIGVSLGKEGTRAILANVGLPIGNAMHQNKAGIAIISGAPGSDKSSGLTLTETLEPSQQGKNVAVILSVSHFRSSGRRLCQDGKSGRK